MPNSKFTDALKSTREIQITFTGRKSGRSISTPVWFVHEGNKLYLLPVTGTNSNWYKNVQKSRAMKISADGTELTTKVRPKSDSGKAKEVADKFRSKYGASEVKKYYSKFDACVEVEV